MQDRGESTDVKFHDIRIARRTERPHGAADNRGRTGINREVDQIPFTRSIVRLCGHIVPVHVKPAKSVRLRHHETPAEHSIRIERLDNAARLSPRPVYINASSGESRVGVRRNQRVLRPGRMANHTQEQDHSGEESAKQPHATPRGESIPLHFTVPKCQTI